MLRRIIFRPYVHDDWDALCLSPSRKLCWGRTKHLPHARPAIFETLLAPVPSVLHGAPSLRLPGSLIRLNRSRPTLVFSLQLSIFTLAPNIAQHQLLLHILADSGILIHLF